MKRPSETALSERTRTLLAEHGIEVTEQGVARARTQLREAATRTTPADWRRLREYISAAAL